MAKITNYFLKIAIYWNKSIENQSAQESFAGQLTRKRQKNREYCQVKGRNEYPLKSNGSVFLHHRKN